ncbi:MAG: NAD(P)H-hydrate dehydratase [Patescibacteria group bacterium]|nr:NAD(P)H-hydrate dehydratase [Patescibacteria group bacterium]
MEEFNVNDLKKLYVPVKDSHKGQNGKLMVIGGSVLFHAASLWALNIASRIVDMVFYSSVDSNNEIVQKEKQEFRDGIIVPRDKIEHYIDEADAILIGPGLPREEGVEKGDDDTKLLTESLLQKYPQKKWVIDGGSLQVINPEVLPETTIITPHKKEFETLFSLEPAFDNAEKMAQKYNITILLKGKEDIICNDKKSIIIKGGNQGMTKGGTGDVLAGLVAALYCKNDAFLSAKCASFINKKAGGELYKTMGLYYNASDLALEIPKVMKKFIL